MEFVRKHLISAQGVVALCIVAAMLTACGGGSGITPTGTSGGSTCTATSLPGAPSIGMVFASNGYVNVYFTPPLNYVTTGVTSYLVTSTPGGITATGTAFPIKVTGLTNGTAYTFTVQAVNCLGTGPASGSSASATPLGPPGAPTGVTAAAGTATQSASVSFTAPTSTGGAAITGYTVTSSPGNLTATGKASPIQVLGLAGNTSYTFTVTASNSVGAGSASTASAAYTAPALAYTGPFYINSASGADSNPGTAALPFKTVTEGLAVAKAAGLASNTVTLAAGTYNAASGEIFPLMMPNGVTLVGASGAAVTTISGSGIYTMGAGSFGSLVPWITYSTLVFPPGVAAAVSGLSISAGGGSVEVIVDSATATVSSSVIQSLTGGSDGMWIQGNQGAAKATLTGNTIKGTGAAAGLGGLYVSDNATVIARNNILSDPLFAGVTVIGGGTAATSPTVDLGTSTSPGGNTITATCILCSANVGINVYAATNLVYASGNTWNPTVQGASASGTYTAGTKAVQPSYSTGGNNYAVDPSSGGLQF